MLKAAGIVAEFNPFHNGHLHLVESIRQSGVTHVAAVMSGSFVQRGECAAADKFSRAKAAVRCGVDIVAELPAVYACACAERFALGAVGTLDAFGCISELCFGSESGSLESIEQAADVVCDPKFNAVRRELSGQGRSYPQSVAMALEAVAQGDRAAAVLGSPNDTLAVEYIKALRTLGSSIKPHCIQRVGAAHDSSELNSEIASASAVREMMRNGEIWQRFVPPESAQEIRCAIDKGSCPASWKNNERAVLTLLRRMTIRELADLPDVTEGLENRIAEAVKTSMSLDELLTAVKCRRYTHARLRRIITCAYLGVTKETAGLPPAYIRVLAFSDRGAELLKIMKTTAKLPVLMRARDFAQLASPARALLDIDIRSSDLFAACTPRLLPCGSDYYNSAVKL